MKSKENKQFSASIKALEGLEQHLGLNTKVKITQKTQVNSNLQDNFDNAVKETIIVETEQKTKENDKTE